MYVQGHTLEIFYTNVTFKYLTIEILSVFARLFVLSR